MFAELLNLMIGNLIYFALHLSGPSSFPKPLSAQKEREYLEMARGGDMNAREKLIEHNLRLVAHIVKKYYSSYSEQDDLISIGTIGLIKAVDSFKYEKGTRLATYAARCIENVILTQWLFLVLLAMKKQMQKCHGEYGKLKTKTYLYCTERNSFVSCSHPCML